jgi:hypothetical protein
MSNAFLELHARPSGGGSMMTENNYNLMQMQLHREISTLSMGVAYETMSSLDRG